MLKAEAYLRQAGEARTLLQTPLLKVEKRSRVKENFYAEFNDLDMAFPASQPLVQQC